MKKLTALFLCFLFLNLMFCPVTFADTDTQSSETSQVETSNGTVTKDTAKNIPDTQSEVSAHTQNANQTTVQAQTDNVIQNANTARTEQLAIRKNHSKKISVESVYISAHDVEIPASDILQIEFINDFYGKKAHVGDTIEFRFPNDIVTTEGTMILPATTRIVATITDLKKPKPFRLSGKVYLDFKYLQFADGTQKPIDARLYGKKDFLSRKTLNQTEAVGETVVTSGAGMVTGAVIGAASSNVAVIVLGGLFGAGLGAIAGVAVGILLPGASFKAKAGQRVNIELTRELDI